MRILALAGLLAGLPSQGTTNPEYLWWASCKPGSSVTFAMDVDGRPQEGTKKVVLKDLTARDAQLEESQSIPALGPASTSTRTVPVSIQGSLFTNPAKTGDEEILVASKPLTCRWVEGTRTAAGGASELVRVWLNDAVPGHVVRTRVTKSDGSVATLTATAWNRK